ncbi:MAG TPA: GntR family transcriptional regulator [Actinophytocola sp.]|uniref:GntR family transcriptional regulator n=1 Tax=Actinophytocola sp. TaxID=1872138 RepID=UPI002DB81854|nr:GntR family transcriptional regulator [Actinophytocola sp.]HEU5473058.1 GntR family transcriptional regulator [Actinophytocola sp.]
MDWGRIVLDPGSGLAPWRQVHDQILWLVQTGRLAVGARLPTIRRLAGDLGVAPGTVARAYRELEEARVLRTARRNGTVVAAQPAAPDRLEPLATAAAAYAATARTAGADVHRAVAAVVAAFDRVTWSGTGSGAPRSAG